MDTVEALRAELAKVRAQRNAYARACLLLFIAVNTYIFRWYKSSHTRDLKVARAMALQALPFKARKMGDVRDNDQAKGPAGKGAGGR